MDLRTLMLKKNKKKKKKKKEDVAKDLESIKLKL